MSETDSVYPVRLKRELELEFTHDFEADIWHEIGVRLDDHLAIAIRLIIHQFLVEGLDKHVRFTIR